MDARIPERLSFSTILTLMHRDPASLSSRLDSDCGDGLRLWGCWWISRLDVSGVVSVGHICTSVEGDGHGYDGPWDRRGCGGGVARGRLHGIYGWSVREDD